MKMMMIVFLLLPLLGITYLAWHVWCLLPTSWIWKALAVMLLVGSFLMMFSMRGGLDRMPLGLATAVYEVSTSSLIVMLYLVLAFLLLDLGRLLHIVPRTWLYANWWTAGGICAAMLAIFVYGNLHYNHKYREPIDITSAKIKRPLRLVMVSDLHIGYHNRRQELHRWIDIINSERPDYVLIAGDIIDMSMRPLKEENMAQEFHRLKAPIYACLGNHEYFSSEPAAQQFYREAGIHLLQDSAALLGDLCIIGRDDRTNMRRRPLADIVAAADANLSAAGSTLSAKYTILLDHQPYHLEEAEQQKIDFQMSGHTHYGQVWPISWITDAIYECAFGSHQRGNTHYYVSSGLGIWGGKFRIGTRSEYVVLNLQTR
ncbi:MAG: metallophosphoesterase [Prevotella sp.]|nr:metallophosphoesterase [Prevotella sp.]